MEVGPLAPQHHVASTQEVLWVNVEVKLSDRTSPSMAGHTVGPSENAPRSIVGALQADAQAKGSCRIAMKMNKAGEEGDAWGGMQC